MDYDEDVACTSSMCMMQEENIGYSELSNWVTGKLKGDIKQDAWKKSNKYVRVIIDGVAVWCKSTKLLRDVAVEATGISCIVNRYNKKSMLLTFTSDEEYVILRFLQRIRD